MHRIFRISTVVFGCFFYSAIASSIQPTISSDTASVPTASPFVPLTHPVYSFLKTLALPSTIDGVDLSVRPLTETDVVTVLHAAQSRGLITDSAFAEEYFVEFGDRTIRGVVRDRVPKIQIEHQGNSVEAYPTFFTRSGVEDSAYDIRGYRPYRLDSLSDTRGFRTINNVGITAIGNVSGLVLYFNGQVTTEYSTVERWYKVMHPEIGEIHTTIFAEPGEAGHFRGSDEFRTYVYYPNRILDVKIGNDQLAWGRGEDLSFVFSPLQQPFVNIQVHKNLGTLDFNYVFGKLIADRPDQRRIVYAKRFSYGPRDWLALGFSDLVITINRDIEGLYFFPLLPFYFSEHFIGDPDNRLMGFDAMVKFKKYGAFYGELFLDDLQNFASFINNDSWGDKWAYLLGGTVFNPLPSLPSHLKVEFAQVEPWVYTTSARDNDDVRNYPIHAGELLGNAYGPHSRVLRGELAVHFTPKMRACAQVEQMWKGDSAGSSPYDINKTITKVTASGQEQLRPTYETKEYRFTTFQRNRTSLSLRLDYRPRYWCTFFGAIGGIRERVPHTDNSFSCILGATFNQ